MISMLRKILRNKDKEDKKKYNKDKPNFLKEKLNSFKEILQFFKDKLSFKIKKYKALLDMPSKIKLEQEHLV